MASFYVPDATRDAPAHSATTPLVMLFERDDAIAVPLLSQLRLAGYDVRSARTPVELFDTLGKNLVALVLVDLGVATAGRREFWVALDAQRRGRALQVMTYRYLTPTTPLEPEFDPAARALADVDVHGPQDLPTLIAAVRQRIPLHQSTASAAPAVPGAAPMAHVASAGQMPEWTPGTMAPPRVPLPSSGDPMALPHARTLFPQTTAMLPPGAAAVYPQPGYGPFPGAPQAPAAQPYAGAQPYAPLAYPPPSGAAAPWEASPFAHPGAANPFAREAEYSPFAQPYAINPFAGQVGVEPASQPVAAAAPLAMPSGDLVYDQQGWSHTSTPQVAPSTPQVDRTPPGVPAMPGAPDSYGAPAPAAFSDAWIPPDSDAADEASSAYEPTYQPVSMLAGERAAGIEWAAGHAAPQRPLTQVAVLERREAVHTQPTFGQGETAPVSLPLRNNLPNNLPAVQSQAEQALSTVLVEGALLTPAKLEVLTGIQQMLSSVDMSFKLGELALLFRFLSPDQLLAALLVSRGLVSPQQIAGLGRVKQELAASGMDHDLESLLIMFHILPAEQLRRLRAELV